MNLFQTFLHQISHNSCFVCLMKIDLIFYLCLNIKMFNQWCTIESDPGVFTELVKKMGAPGVQVQQVYSLDDDDLINRVKPNIYGFVFLFKWTKDIEKKEYLLDYDKDLFFARQIVNNACATQANLSILLNAPIHIEGPLKQFYQFAKELPPEDRGLALSNSETIRIIHNSFSRPEPFIFKEDKRKKKKQADIYHFISYVPHKGHLYELDGLQPGPILIGKYEKPEEWIELAKKEIKERLSSFGQEIRFNLMVVCEDLKLKASNQIQQHRAEQASIAKALKELSCPYNEQILSYNLDVEASGQTDPQKLNGRLNQLMILVEQKEAFCQAEDCRGAERKEQNIRRKHNYIPLIVQVLKTLAKKNKIGELIDKATTKKQQSS